MALCFFVHMILYCSLKNDIALGGSASCNIIFQSAIKIDIALTIIRTLAIRIAIESAVDFI